MNNQASLIMNEVARYRVASIDLLRDSFPSIDVDNTIQRLVRRRKLLVRRHRSGLRCVVLPNRKPLSNEAIARALAIQCYCRDSALARPVLQKTEIRKYFPSIFRVGLPSGFYVRISNDSFSLGNIRVDVQARDVGRVLSDCHRLTKKYQGQPGFRELIAANQFEITFLVATKSKAECLQRAFERLHKTGIAFQTVEIPLLLELLAPLSTRSRP